MKNLVIFVFLFSPAFSQILRGQQYGSSLRIPAARASYLRSQQYSNMQSPRMRSLISGGNVGLMPTISPFRSQNYNQGIFGSEGKMRGIGRSFSTARTFYGKLYPEESYFIPDPNTGKPITCYEPSLLSLFGYPFPVEENWTVYGCMTLGVPPPPPTGPIAEPFVSYTGYYFTCPQSLNVEDPSAWNSGLIENLCEYQLYV